MSDDEKADLETLRTFVKHILAETEEVVQRRHYMPIDELDPNTYIETQVFVRFLHEAKRVVDKAS